MAELVYTDVAVKLFLDCTGSDFRWEAWDWILPIQEPQFSLGSLIRNAIIMLSLFFVSRHLGACTVASIKSDSSVLLHI